MSKHNVIAERLSHVPAAVAASVRTRYAAGDSHTKLRRDFQLGEQIVRKLVASVARRPPMLPGERWLPIVGPLPPGMHTCHGPGGQQDNRVANLRYDTPRANMLDSSWWLNR